MKISGKPRKISEFLLGLLLLYAKRGKFLTEPSLWHDEKLSSDIKAKKAELKQLLKVKAKADKAAAAKKAEEDKASILAAVEASGKSVEEILELLK